MTGIASVTGGVCLLVPAVAEALRYSPYENPGAGTAALLLFICFLVLTGLPALFLAIRVFGAIVRQHARLVSHLTPGQRILLYWSEFAGLLVAHEIFRHRNRETSERLTASVMGETPENPSQED